MPSSGDAASAVLAGSASAVLEWLLEGDVAVVYQTRRDLLGCDDGELRARIAREGVGAALLAARGPDGHWGRGFYEPKWTCTHYTLLELAGLGLDPAEPAPREAVGLVLETGKGRDGGLDPTRALRRSDVCVNGMALRYAAYFGAPTEQLASIVDFVLGEHMPVPLEEDATGTAASRTGADGETGGTRAGRARLPAAVRAAGGFNCRRNRSGARHPSAHSTVCVLEGITEYLRQGHSYRAEELVAARDRAVEFFLAHRIYRSRRTGEPMDVEFTRLHHPARWHFDVLRGLDALRDAGVPADERMSDALALLRARQRPDGRWVVNRSYPGQTHVPPPRAGQPERWVTLTAVRVLAAYEQEVTT